MGTPSYMAPEQAEGKSRESGPAVDTYALVRILYQMLTGRPPFTGDTTIDVLMQVIWDQPMPPSRRQRGAARPGEDLSEVPGKGPPPALRQRGRSRRRIWGAFLAGEPVKTALDPLAGARRHVGQALSRSCHGDGDDCVGGDARDGGKRDWGVVGSGGGSACAKLKTTNDQLEIAVDVAENAKIVAENRKVIAEKATASEKKAKDELAIAKQTVDHFLYCDRILLVWKYLQAGDTAQAKASHKECDELHRKFEVVSTKEPP